MQTSAVLLDDRIPDGRDSANLSWNESWVRLESASLPSVLNLSLFDTQFEIGGNRQSFLFIKHPSLGAASVYTELTPELRAYLQKHPHLGGRLRNDLGAFRSQRRTGLLAIALVAAIFAALFVFRSQIASGLVTLIPFSTEKKIADLVYARRQVNKNDESKKKADEQLAQLVEPLLAAHPDWRSKLTFHFDSDKTPNAYATIGGHIFINRGLVELLKTPEELLGVIAHEAAHANERHVARSVFQGVGLFLIVQTLLGDFTGLVAVLADQGTPLLMFKHSRELETEADRTAVRDLVKAKVNPNGLISSLGLLDAEAKKMVKGQPTEKIAEFLSKVDLWSTHPEMELRIQNLRNVIAEFKDVTFAPLKFDYANFQETVRKDY